VDPYVIGGQPLIRLVAKTLSRAPLFPLEERRCRDARRRSLYSELGSFLATPAITCLDLIESPKASLDIKDWATRVKPNLDWQFDRYARYLRCGTLLPLA